MTAERPAGRRTLPQTRLPTPGALGATKARTTRRGVFGCAARFSDVVLSPREHSLRRGQGALPDGCVMRRGDRVGSWLGRLSTRTGNLEARPPLGGRAARRDAERSRKPGLLTPGAPGATKARSTRRGVFGCAARFSDVVLSPREHSLRRGQVALADGCVLRRGDKVGSWLSRLSTRTGTSRRGPHLAAEPPGGTPNAPATRLPTPGAPGATKDANRSLRLCGPVF